MNFFESVYNRRSIRKYKTIPVEREKVDEILKAAMYAPSANNQQAWCFYVITERDKLNKLSEIHPYAKMLQQAPLAILVCADLSIAKSPDYWVQDCSAATQNILLSAYALGLGSVWLGVHPRETRVNAMKEYFNLPENIHPLSLIAIGYADEQKEMPERFNLDRITYL
jgi:nitroreductase